MNNLLPLQRELHSITLALSLYGFAAALIGVFIPLIILQSGAPLSRVAEFYAIYALVKLILNYPAALIIQRYGAHVGLAGGFVAGAFQMLAILLYANTHSLPALALGAAALAITNAFLWNSQHIHISQIMDTATKSSSMATIEIVHQLTTVAAPLIGGLIAATIGPAWVLGIALGIALAALIPLHAVAALHRHTARVATTNLPRLAYNLRGAPLRDIIANFFFNIDTAIGSLLWPVYLAVTISSYHGIGLISTLSATAAVITVWLAGRRGDQGHDRAVLRHGVIASSAIHLLRLDAATPLTITILSSGYRAALAYFQNAWVSTYYTHAKERGISYVMSMEIACDLAYASLWGLILVLSFSVTPAALFNICFVIAAAASWGCLLITRQAQPD
jgi:MFS family permease